MNNKCIVRVTDEERVVCEATVVYGRIITVSRDQNFYPFANHNRPGPTGLSPCPFQFQHSFNAIFHLLSRRMHPMVVNCSQVLDGDWCLRYDQARFTGSEFLSVVERPSSAFPPRVWERATG